MATTYPLATLGCTIDANGISAPPYSDIYQSLQASFQAIYGSDAYIDPDSQDGQLLAIVAKAQSDSNDNVIAAYNNFSPATAQGVGLSSVVKINGIKRNSASNSQASVRVAGQVGSQILNGIIADNLGAHKWLLPALVTIPPAGFIDVTATCVDAGNITALAGTLTAIVTPTLGWQSVTSLTDASPGAPIEVDASLRQRQTTSTALPSQTVLDGIRGAIALLTGVTQVVVYENDTDAPDANGLPEHSISAVVLGGVDADIANAINLKKTPGAFTYGTTAIIILDSYGIPKTIRFYHPTDVAIKVGLTIQSRTGYSTAIGEQIKAAVAAYINALGIGRRVDIGKLYLPGQLYGGIGSSTFDLNIVQIAIVPAALGNVDIEIAFNQRATCLVANIALTVT